VKDYPKWTDGWNIGKVTPSKKKARESDQGSHEDTPKFSSIAEGEGNMDFNNALQNRSSEMKVAKEVQKLAKACEDALHTQEAATKVMAVATMKKVALLEDNNRLLLMTTPEAHLRL
jgi:hypothetical protein